MRFKRKKEEEIDPTTKRLLDSGVIRINSPSAPPTTTQKIKDFGMVTYDFWSGVKYIIVLSALLFWLPLFGPMLAGYVGGRRTGGPKKGLIAAIAGLLVIASAHFILTNALIPTVYSDKIFITGSIVSGLSNIHILSPYVDFIQLYWGSFFTTILGGLPYSPNSYIITVIFAYVGGIITVDKQREILRAEKKEAPSVMVNVPWGQPVRRERAAPRRSSRRAVSAPVRHTRLKDMKRINMNDKPRESSSYESVPMVKQQEPERSSFLSKLPKREVKHHSSYDDEDWELL